MTKSKTASLFLGTNGDRLSTLAKAVYRKGVIVAGEIACGKKWLFIEKALYAERWSFGEVCAENTLAARIRRDRLSDKAEKPPIDKAAFFLQTCQ